MKITIIRPPISECINSTIGEVFLNDDLDHRFAFSLELPWRDNQHYISCIPEGTYQVDMFEPESDKWHKAYNWITKLPVLLRVPSRSGIEIHIANYPHDLLGCIGMGDTKAPDFIGNSVLPIKALYGMITEALAKNEYVSIEIKRKEEGL